MTAWSLRHPVAVQMLVVASLVVGALGLFRMRLSLLPDISLPVLTVVVRLPGASAREVEAQVLEPLEEAVSGSAGLERMEGWALPERALLVLRHGSGTDPLQAASRLRERLDRLRNTLPPSAEPPLVLRADPGERPAMRIFARNPEGEGEGDALLHLRERLDERLLPELEKQVGVARVVPGGGLLREISVTLSPSRLSLRGLSAARVADRIEEAGRDEPVGALRSGGREEPLRWDGSWRSLADLASLPLPGESGPSPSVPRALLRDVARIGENGRFDGRRVFHGGKEGVVLDVVAESGANRVALSKAVRRCLDRLGEAADFRAEILEDEALPVRRTLLHLVLDACLGGGAAVVVLSLLLSDAILPLVVAVALPVSLLAALAVLHLLGYGLDGLTLGGLTVACGLILDNAIVVVDSFQSARERGESPRDAALLGAKRVGLSVVTATAALLVVFLPLPFLKGLLGAFFRDLSVAVVASLVASLLACLCLLPVLLGGRFPFLAREKTRDPRRTTLSGRSWRRIEEFYGRTLRLALRNRRVVLGAYPIVVIASVLLLFRLDAELVPRTPSRRMTAVIELPRGTPLEITAALGLRIERRLREKDGVKETFVDAGSCGELDEDACRSGSHLLRLRLETERKGDGRRVERFLRDEALPPGATWFLRSEGSGGLSVFAEGEEVVADFAGREGESARRASALLGERIAADPRFAGIRFVDEGALLVPGRSLRPRRERLASAGLGAEGVAETLRVSCAGRAAGAFREKGKDLPVRVQLEEGVVPERLALRTDAGRLVPLGRLLVACDVREPGFLRHVQKRPVSRGVLLLPSGAPRSLRADLRILAADSARKTGADLLPDPARIALREQMTELGGTFALSVLFIYLLLAARLADLRTPLLLMAGIPLLFFGVGTALLATGQTLNLFSGLAFLLLAGAIVREGVLLVETYRTPRNPSREEVVWVNDGEGRLVPDRSGSDDEFVIRASVSRLRPVVAIGLTAMISVLPIALGLGEGVEIQRPLAVAMIGGLGFSGLLTLVVLPVGFVAFSGRGADALKEPIP